GRVQTSLDDAGAEAVTFTATTFGENCVDATSGEVRRFVGRELTFTLSVAGQDATALGDALAIALDIVNLQVKVQSVPVAQVRVLFADADLDPITLEPAMLDRALEGDATGAALVARLYDVALR